MAIAGRSGAAVVSVDSMQVYRGMDIGTAKPAASIRAAIPHFMIDVAEPTDEYSVAEFQRIGVATLDEFDQKGRPALIAGGSGLHFRALVDALSFPPTDPVLRAQLEEAEVEELVVELLAADPHASAHVDLANPRRVVRAVEILRVTGSTPSSRAGHEDAQSVRDYVPTRPVLAVGFDPGDRLRERIVTRFDRMLGSGLVEEVRSLEGSLGPTARQAVGYKELLPFVRGAGVLADGRAAAIASTVALAKRQRTFFRRDPRIHWLPWHDDPDERTAAVLDVAGELPWIL